MSFITSLRSIFVKMDPELTISRQLDITCDNLNPNFIHFIKRNSINSFEVLVSEGRQIESKNEKIKNYKATQATPVPWEELKDQRKHKKTEDSAPLAIAREKSSCLKPKQNKTKTLQNTTNPSISSSDPTQESKKSDLPISGQCWKCKKTGHRWRICTSQVRKIFCYGCGKPNVIKTKCDKCASILEENKEGAHS